MLACAALRTPPRAGGAGRDRRGGRTWTRTTWCGSVGLRRRADRRRRRCSSSSRGTRRRRGWVLAALRRRRGRWSAAVADAHRPRRHPRRRAPRNRAVGARPTPSRPRGCSVPEYPRSRPRPPPRRRRPRRHRQVVADRDALPRAAPTSCASASSPTTSTPTRTRASCAPPGVLDPERIRAVETGACPHTAIRDDVTANLLAVEDLERDFAPAGRRASSSPAATTSPPRSRRRWSTRRSSSSTSPAAATSRARAAPGSPAPICWS